MSHNNRPEDDTQLLRPGPAERDGAAGQNEPPTILLDRPKRATTDVEVIEAEEEIPSRRELAAEVGAGTVLQGRFALVELVGEGGMSRVFKAIDRRRVEARSENPFLAVKVLTVSPDHHLASIQTLDREAHKLQSLTHPNIVRVIDVDRDGPTVFMTMELLSGESLLGKLRRADGAGLPRAEAQAIIAGIANALEFAHRAGIVHGDLKPGNVIITATGEVKVIDFGIARCFVRPLDRAKAAELGGLVPDTEQDWEAINALTPPYASPEMLQDQEPDPRDDIYALACIAYELLTGEHPFKRVSAIEARDAVRKIVPHPAVTTTQLRAITHGLQFERQQRTASAAAFADEFCGRRSRSSKLPLIGAAVAAALILAWVGWNFFGDAALTERSEPLATGQLSQSRWLSTACADAGGASAHGGTTSG